ncbi:MAG: flagellar hook capping FlgD N-terminal domain-containing protein [Blastocatellia bacterium]
MNISPIINNKLPVATSGTSATKNSTPDQETFLKLLVAQLKNQDPLAPQDGTQFVAQLAQFSSLDQLININQQLAELLNKK